MNTNNECQGKVDELTKQVAQVSIIQSPQQHDQTAAIDAIKHATAKKIPPSRSAAKEEDEEPVSMTFYGLSEDVEKFIPQQSYVLVLNRHEYEVSDEEMMADQRELCSDTDNPPMDTGVTNETPLQVLASWIQNARRILVVSGAGVSVSAGIPDFRTKGTGLVRTIEG